ncbi:hypothetical protein AB6A40_007804 [Gnathostoma spinigerum]|uniref:Uncharacterized protein n=1 Tax=Gnathostoma spinigerum TaxID=75299 RepID=A0ABD6EMB6_9BILA
MRSSVAFILLFVAFCAVAFEQLNNPSKRVILSRYGRSIILSRYGKRSFPPLPSEDDSQVTWLEGEDGSYMCRSQGSTRLTCIPYFNA